MKAIFDFRVCNNCGYPYLYTNRKGFGRNGGDCGDADPKYCFHCTDSYVRLTFKLPPELLDVKRLALAGRRLLKMDFPEHTIEILQEIIKHKNHESYSTARSIVGYFNKSKKGNDRSAISQADF